MDSCAFCKHIFDQFPLACAAFPDGIPMQIISGEVAHLEPLPGDHGIQYEKSERRLQIEAEDLPQ